SSDVCSSDLGHHLVGQRLDALCKHRRVLLGLYLAVFAPGVLAPAGVVAVALSGTRTASQFPPPLSSMKFTHARKENDATRRGETRCGGSGLCRAATGS